jgi:hypothetical protein
VLLKDKRSLGVVAWMKQDRVIGETIHFASNIYKVRAGYGK